MSLPAFDDCHLRHCRPRRSKYFHLESSGHAPDRADLKASPSKNLFDPGVVSGRLDAAYTKSSTASTAVKR